MNFNFTFYYENFNNGKLYKSGNEAAQCGMIM